MQEHPGRCCEQQQPDEQHTLVGGGRGLERLGHEARGEREGRDCQRTDDAVNRSHRHALEQAAEIGALALAGHQQHAAGRHQQQGLVDDVREGMRSGAVQRHRGPDADRRDHEADLVDNRIGQNAAHVVLEQRVDDAVEHHVQADRDENVGAGEPDQQREYGGLGRERRQEYRAARAGLRIGVGNPGRQRRCSGIDQEADEDQPVAEAVRLHRGELERAGLEHVRDDADHQHDAAEQVDEQVAQAGSVGALRAGRPDDDGRAERHDLPEHEHGDQIAGKGHADRRAGIDERRSQFGDAGLTMGVQTAGKGHDRKYGCKQAALGGRADRLEGIVEEAELQRRVGRQAPYGQQGQYWQTKQHQPTLALAEQRDQHGTKHHDQAGWKHKFTHHSKCPCVSGIYRESSRPRPCPRSLGNHTRRRNQNSYPA